MIIAKMWKLRCSHELDQPDYIFPLYADFKILSKLIFRTDSVRDIGFRCMASVKQQQKHRSFKPSKQFDTAILPMFRSISNTLHGYTLKHTCICLANIYSSRYYYNHKLQTIIIR